MSVPVYMSNDYNIGTRNENRLLKKLQRKYPDIVRNDNQYGWYDYVSHEHKVLIELKTVVKTYHFNIRSYRVGYDKVENYKKSQYKKKGYKFFLYYDIGGTIVKYKLSGKNKNSFRIITDKRTDRGRNEVEKEYIIIKREEFKMVYRLGRHLDIVPLDYFVETIGTCIIDDSD